MAGEKTSVTLGLDTVMPPVGVMGMGMVGAMVSIVKLMTAIWVLESHSLFHARAQTAYGPSVSVIVGVNDHIVLPVAESHVSLVTQVVPLRNRSVGVSDTQAVLLRTWTAVT